MKKFLALILIYILLPNITFLYRSILNNPGTEGHAVLLLFSTLLMGVTYVLLCKGLECAEYECKEGRLKWLAVIIPLVFILVIPLKFYKGEDFTIRYLGYIGKCISESYTMILVLNVVLVLTATACTIRLRRILEVNVDADDLPPRKLLFYIISIHTLSFLIVYSLVVQVNLYTTIFHLSSFIGYSVCIILIYLQLKSTLTPKAPSKPLESRQVSIRKIVREKMQEAPRGTSITELLKSADERMTPISRDIPTPKEQISIEKPSKVSPPAEPNEAPTEATELVETTLQSLEKIEEPIDFKDESYSGDIIREEGLEDTTRPKEELEELMLTLRDEIERLHEIIKKKKVR